MYISPLSTSVESIIIVLFSCTNRIVIPGGYMYISPLSTSVESITSPLITSERNLKCVRLWYFLSNGRAYGSEINVHLVTNNIKELLWRSSTEITTWQYVQLPLTYHKDFRVGYSSM